MVSALETLGITLLVVQKVKISGAGYAKVLVAGQPIILAGPASGIAWATLDVFRLVASEADEV